MATPSPGWYPDARNPELERWWDGAQWTEHSRPRVGAHAHPTPRSSTPSGVEVKTAGSRDGLVGKAWSHAILTAVGIAVSALVTGAFGQQKQQEIKREGGHALLKSQEIISELLTTQKAAQAELLSCRAGSQPPKPGNAGPDANAAKAEPTPAPVAVSLDGSWSTPDGTVVWDIRDNRATIRSVGQLAGFVDGSGQLSLNGTQVTGTVTAATYYGMAQGAATLQGQLVGDYINGTMQDQAGTSQAFVLVRSRGQAAGTP